MAAKDANFLDLLQGDISGGRVSGSNYDSSFCVGQADCRGGKIIKPLNAAGLAPWVICSFVDCNPIKGDQIAATVGSFDPAVRGSKKRGIVPPESIIKSFSCGFSDGIGCKLEILDRKGTKLGNFFKNLDKEIDQEKTKSNFIMKIMYGWTSTVCPGKNASNKYGNMPSSKCIYYLPNTLQINYTQGGFRYILEGIDTQQKQFQTNNDKIYPEGGGKMKLKDAVIQAWKESIPSTKVSFKRKLPPVPGQPGRIVDIAEPFVNESGQPAMSIWKCDGVGTMAAVVNWKGPFKTDKGKGLKPVWNDKDSEPHITYIESGCEVLPSDQCLRTYIVNGGKHSPVISFNPTIAWNPQATAEAYGGGAGSTDTGASHKRVGVDENDCIVVKSDDGVGVRTAIPPTEASVENEGPDNAQKATDSAMAAQAHANNELNEPISAELIVQGDPQMCHILDWIPQYISIVVVNPFHPVLSAGGKSGQIKTSEWLANPTCNPILTSKTYRITAINHDIKEGSYTTTIKVEWDPGLKGRGGANPK
jgi:hypothetical protein